MDEDTCTKIELMPIGLGLTKKKYLRNLPHPATEEETKKIYDYLVKASEPYGTKLTLREDGKIEVAVD
jgi:hypothetical protein